MPKTKAFLKGVEPFLSPSESEVQSVTPQEQNHSGRVFLKDNSSRESKESSRISVSSSVEFIGL